MTKNATRPGDTPSRHPILRRAPLATALTLTSALLMTVAIASQAHTVTSGPANIDKAPDRLAEWPRA